MDGRRVYDRAPYRYWVPSPKHYNSQNRLKYDTNDPEESRMQLNLQALQNEWKRLFDEDYRLRYMHIQPQKRVRSEEGNRLGRKKTDCRVFEHLV